MLGLPRSHNLRLRRAAEPHDVAGRNIIGIQELLDLLPTSVDRVPGVPRILEHRRNGRVLSTDHSGVTIQLRQVRRARHTVSVELLRDRVPPPAIQVELEFPIEPTTQARYPQGHAVPMELRPAQAELIAEPAAGRLPYAGAAPELGAFEVRGSDHAASGVGN